MHAFEGEDSLHGFLHKVEDSGVVNVVWGVSVSKESSIDLVPFDSTNKVVSSSLDKGDKSKHQGRPSKVEQHNWAQGKLEACGSWC